MTIRYKCPHCGTRTSVADQHAGQVASCAQCGRFTMIPVRGSTVPEGVTDNAEVVFIGDGRGAPRWGRRVMIAIGCLAVLTSLVAALHTAGSAASLRARRHQCPNNLKRIGLALHAYHDVYGCLPPPDTTDADGRPLCSWRVLLLPYLGYERLYDEYCFDEPWDSSRNLEVYRKMPSTYRCQLSDEETGLCNYVVIVGAAEQDPQTMFTPGRGMRFEDVHDGMSATIMVAEVRYGVPWTMPTADLQFDTMTMRINGSPASISSRHEFGANVGMADASVRELPSNLYESELRNLLQPADGF